MLTLEQLAPILDQVFINLTLPLPKKTSGKVRESYALPQGHRLLITTDRLSTFDRIVGAVPYKGQVLNQLSAWWFQQLADIVPHPILSLPDPNAVVMWEVEPYPIEVIVRGYITGVTVTALWHRYALGERNIYGYHFPEGLQKNQALPEPIITPTTKGGPTGRDERLSCVEVVNRGLVTPEAWAFIQTTSLALFKQGQQLAKRAGLLLVDTKYEFGRTAAGDICLIDEVHTPDSSRFWLAASYPEKIASGMEPENFDKEFIRLAYAEHSYQGLGEPPILAATTWLQASQRYIALYEKLTGNVFCPRDYPVIDQLQGNLHRAGLL